MKVGSKNIHTLNTNRRLQSVATRDVLERFQIPQLLSTSRLQTILLLPIIT